LLACAGLFNCLYMLCTMCVHLSMLGVISHRRTSVLWGRDEMLESYDVVPSEVGAEENKGGNLEGRAAGTSGALLERLETSFHDM
jgi:hypothetical protein